MPKPVAIPPPGFDELTVEEQIDYVQSLWDRIAATPEQALVPDWHREVLDERLKDCEANLHTGESWDVVRDRLRDKLRQRKRAAAHLCRFQPTCDTPFCNLAV